MAQKMAPDPPGSPKMAKNSEKVAVCAAIRVERRTFVSPDILRLKPENYEIHANMFNYYNKKCNLTLK